MSGTCLQSTGKIRWDYKIMSVPAYAYAEGSAVGQLAIEILCIMLLSFNCISEISGAVFFKICCVLTLLDRHGLFKVQLTTI